MKLLLFITFLLFSMSLTGYSQSHKFHLESGIITATQLGNGKFELKIDTKEGESRIQFQYKATEGEMYIYDLIKVDNEFLTEYQRSISSLMTRTKFSDLCSGKPDRLLINVLGKAEIISLDSSD